MKKTHVFLILLSLAAITGGMGCVALSEIVTPAAIDQRAVGYAAAAGVADANDFAGYGNLAKATRLTGAVADAHQVNQMALAQRIEADTLAYSQLIDATVNNRTAAMQRENQLFGEKGLLSMGLSLAGFGTLTGVVGLMRKRPGDITPEEMKQAIAGEGAKLTEKEKQFAELVKGVQGYLDHPIVADSSGAVLKGELAKATSDATKKAVAVLKA